MARAVALSLLVAILAVCASSATAHKFGKHGKGKLRGYGKGHVSYTTQCEEVCRDQCYNVAKPVCADVQVPYKECGKVPVSATVKRCGKVCQRPEPLPLPIPEPIHVAPVYHKGPSFGKGRHLLGKGKPLLHKGKGVAIAPIAPIQCETVCADVPVTRYEVQCQTLTRTVQTCKKTFEQVCSKKCRPVCVKVPVMVEPVVVHPAPVHPAPVFVSSGKGKALPALPHPGLGKGLGH